MNNSSNSKTKVHHEVHPSGNIFPEGESNVMALVLFQARSQNYEKRLLVLSCLSVYLPARNN
jgi:hypothetical protein